MNREQFRMMIENATADQLVEYVDELDTELLLRTTKQGDFFYYLNIFKEALSSNGIITATPISKKAVNNIKRYVIPLFVSNKEQAVIIIPLFVADVVKKSSRISLNLLLVHYLQHFKLYVDAGQLMLARNS